MNLDDRKHRCDIKGDLLFQEWSSSLEEFFRNMERIPGDKCCRHGTYDIDGISMIWLSQLAVGSRRVPFQFTAFVNSNVWRNIFQYPSLY